MFAWGLGLFVFDRLSAGMGQVRGVRGCHSENNPRSI